MQPGGVGEDLEDTGKEVEVLMPSDFVLGHG
jgi:hypothetical protein